MPARPAALARGFCAAAARSGLHGADAASAASRWRASSSSSPAPSFVYTEQFGLSPTGFSLAFALNAIGFFAASQMAASLGERFGMARVVRLAVTAFAAITTLLFVVALAGYGSLPVIIAMLLRRQRLPRAW